MFGDCQIEESFKYHKKINLKRKIMKEFTGQLKSFCNNKNVRNMENYSYNPMIDLLHVLNDYFNISIIFRF